MLRPGLTQRTPTVAVDARDKARAVPIRLDSRNKCERVPQSLWKADVDGSGAEPLRLAAMVMNHRPSAICAAPEQAPVQIATR